MVLGGLAGRVDAGFIVDVLEFLEPEQCLSLLLGDLAWLAGVPGATAREPAREPIGFQLNQRHGDLLDVLQGYLYPYTRHDAREVTVLGYLLLRVRAVSESQFREPAELPTTGSYLERHQGLDAGRRALEARQQAYPVARAVLERMIFDGMMGGSGGNR